MIENHASGERILLLQTAEATGGRLLRFELQLAPGARVPAAHSHPEQSETFVVIEGTVRFRLGLRSHVVGSGGQVVVPGRTMHSFANIGEIPARLIVEVRPALRTEELLKTAAMLGSPKGKRQLPRPIDLVLFLSDFEREVAVPVIPARLVRAGIAAIAALARRAGLDRRYRQLRTPSH
jgi:mannose-6-phosphate isomerase-like protein (cupin superfamily)